MAGLIPGPEAVMRSEYPLGIFHDHIAPDVCPKTSAPLAGLDGYRPPGQAAGVGIGYYIILCRFSGIRAGFHPLLADSDGVYPDDGAKRAPLARDHRERPGRLVPICLRRTDLAIGGVRFGIYCDGLGGCLGDAARVFGGLG